MLDKMFSITTKPDESIMRGKGHLADGLGRKNKLGNMLAFDVVNLCHEEAMKMKCLDDEFGQYYATRQKYFASCADETLEAKVWDIGRYDLYL